MKKALIIIGYLAAAYCSYILVHAMKTLDKPRTDWVIGSAHMNHVEDATMSVMDKCKLDFQQGRIKTHKALAECSTPAIREAFQKEGFTKMDKIDEYLKQRVEFAGMVDSQEITNDERSDRSNDALKEALKFADEHPASK